MTTRRTPIEEAKKRQAVAEYMEGFRNACRLLDYKKRLKRHLAKTLASRDGDFWAEVDTLTQRQARGRAYQEMFAARREAEEQITNN